LKEVDELGGIRPGRGGEHRNGGAEMLQFKTDSAQYSKIFARVNQSDTQLGGHSGPVSQGFSLAKPSDRDMGATRGESLEVVNHLGPTDVIGDNIDVPLELTYSSAGVGPKDPVDPPSVET
jgi:hypothetical protein